MIALLALAGVFWWGGRYAGLGAGLRASLLALLYVAVVLAHLVLSPHAPIRLATGGSAAPWLILAGVAALVALYRAGLRWLAARARPAGAVVARADAVREGFSEVELNRYARHIILREIGGGGQRRLAKARVLVIGAGGLGAPALQYLAAAGVGTIGVIDDDVVEGSNLQRQVIHRDSDIGRPKVFSAQAAMEALNPFVTVRPYHRRLSEEMAAELFEDYDLILDGTDNFGTRYLANRVAVVQKKPLISGALSQWEGQISVFDPARSGPCYQCVFPSAPRPGLAPSCARGRRCGSLAGRSRRDDGVGSGEMFDRGRDCVARCDADL